MKTPGMTASARIAALLLLTGVLAGPGPPEGLTAQSTRMPSTLRYGSGLVDIPVAGVLSHLAITGTYSGFKVNIPGRPLVNDRGVEVDSGEPVSEWYQDGSVALGLFGRLELGSTFQSFSDAGSGGRMIGAFGRALLLELDRFGGLGLAVGTRYVTSPSFDDIAPTVDYAPGRLGFADARLRESYAGGTDGLDTSFSPYLVGSTALPGFDTPVLPDHHLTVAVGWGDGMFRDGNALDWYAPTGSKGWFFGSAVHMEVAENALLNLVGDYNGFDVNLGAQLDWSGVRMGAYALGLNHEAQRSAYRTTRFGVAGSLALCPTDGGLCEPERMEREGRGPDTVHIPPPPPDTVVVEREVGVEPPRRTGEPASMCLATGHEFEVLVTARRDTLVGPDRVSIEALRPGVAFAGSYAGERGWFAGDEPVELDGREYRKSGGEVALRCADIVRVGEHRAVPLFADRSGDGPYETIYLPVRPGVWQAYRAELGGRRG